MMTKGFFYCRNKRNFLKYIFTKKNKAPFQYRKGALNYPVNFIKELAYLLKLITLSSRKYKFKSLVFLKIKVIQHICLNRCHVQFIFGNKFYNLFSINKRNNSCASSRSLYCIPRKI